MLQHLSRTGCRRRQQRGTMAVEFGLGAFVLVMALVGAMEVGRLLWTWNAAAEATRLGARLAAVCDMDEGRIKQRMQQRLPGLTEAQIDLGYLNPGGVAGVCNKNNCRLVVVKLQAYNHEMLVPLPTALGSIPLPPFTTSLPREVFDSGNQVACQ